MVLNNTWRHVLRSLLLSILLTNIALAKTQAQFEVSYLKASNKSEQKIQTWLKKSPEIGLITSIINQEFKLQETLKLEFGEEDGPLFDSENNKILIPYDFLLEVEERFQKAQYATDTGVDNKEATMDALMHTIFHELAHALIFQFDLPVLGKEEDAADGLASVLLIEYLEEGQEVVITAADLFKLESEDIDEYQAQDYWDEHSLDIQRYYSSMCHIYGSSPKQYKQIKTDEKFSDERAENCISDYDVLVDSWLTVLEPFLTKEKE